MRDLTSLPVELLTDIIGFTRPEGFANFISTCKHVHDIAVESNLTRDHAELRRKWSHVDLHSVCHHLELVCEIQKRPILAYYIRWADFSDYSNLQRFKGRTAYNAAEAILRKDNKLLVMLQRSKYLQDAEQDPWHWYKAILGHLSVQFIITYLLMTYIEHLGLPSAWGSDTWGCIASGEGQSEKAGNDITKVLEFLSVKSTDPIYGCLGRFEELNVASYTVNESTPLQAIAPFMTLPSIRTLRAKNLRLGQEDISFKWHRPDLRVHLRALHIGIVSPIASARIETFLTPIHSLQIFEWCQDYTQKGTLEFLLGHLANSPLKDSLPEILVSWRHSTIRREIRGWV